MMNIQQMIMGMIAVAGLTLGVAGVALGEAGAQVVQGSAVSTTQPTSHADGETNQSYVINGDLSAYFTSGEVIVFSRLPRGKGSGGGGMMSAAGTSSASAASSDSPAGPGTKLEGRAELVDGKFQIEGTLDEVHPVYFYVLEGINHEGQKMGPVKGQVFILEPGELSMTMDANANWIVHSKYNDIVINSWKESDDFQEPKRQLTALFKAGVNGEDQAAFNKKVGALQNQYITAEYSARKKIATTHPDMLARGLAIRTGYIIFGWELGAARGILTEAPDDKWAKGYVAMREASIAKREREGRRVNVGDYAKYFDAKTLDGKEVSLWDACGDNKYVLLEFWASWCGPCRAEIPNLKKAYAKYHGDGFEIFSFTIDKDKAAWAKASKDEELPWIDSGFGQESKPKKLYQVSGVPNNYLIDCSTGKVIAKDLRGEALEAKLKELF